MRGGCGPGAGRGPGGGGSGKMLVGLGVVPGLQVVRWRWRGVSLGDGGGFVGLVVGGVLARV